MAIHYRKGLPYLQDWRIELSPLYQAGLTSFANRNPVGDPLSFAIAGIEPAIHHTSCAYLHPIEPGKPHLLS